MKQVIILPNRRAVGLAQYAAAYKKLRTVPAHTMCPGFDHFPERAGDILAKMRRAVHDRINKRGGLEIPPDDIELIRFKHRVNHPRLTLEPWERTVCPPELLALPHIASRFRDSIDY